MASIESDPLRTPDEKRLGKDRNVRLSLKIRKIRQVVLQILKFGQF